MTKAVGSVAAALVLIGGSTSGIQKPPDKLLVPLTDVSINKVPYITAQEGGLYKKHGLEVQLYITEGAARKGEGDGMAPPKEFVGGKGGDLSTGGGVGLTVGKAQRGGDRVILATTDHDLRWHVYAKPEIKTIAELKGKRLGVTGNSSCTGLVGHIIANKQGWTVGFEEEGAGKDLTLVRASEDRLNSLKDGRADAVVINELGFTHAAKMGLKPLIDLSTWDDPFLCSGVSASQAWLKEPGNRDKALRFLKGTLEAIALMHKNDPVAMRAIGKWWGVPDREIQRRMLLTGKEIPRKPYPNIDGIKLVMKLYDSPEMQKLKIEDVYDDSLMRELDKSGFIDNLYK
jgi:ABC-type nitrate/sulfonate/bicarbonate transport system substrate-binding protein